LSLRAANDNHSQPMAARLHEPQAEGRRTARIAAFDRRCREAGLEPTAQRRVIYRRLAESLDHPNAEAVWARVRVDLPRVSLATVYRNLRNFAARGLVEEVATGGSVSRWDANDDEHHHLVCERCGSVTDCYGEDLDRAGLVGAEVEGFEVRSARVNVFGTCPECRENPGEQSP
jgi:Fur family peroxide stress response transcriptional regulator